MRSNSKEGKHPLCFKMNVEGKVRWFNIGISVDVNEWKDASQSERKLNNYLTKKGISKKVALIEEAVADMRRHHRLTKESLNTVIADIVLADKRAELSRIEKLAKENENRKTRNIRNFVVEYISRVESGEARTADKKEKFTKGTCKSWGQFKRTFLDFYDARPFGWEEINEALVDRWISYMESVGYMKSTIAKRVGQLKTIIGLAEKQGLHNNHTAYSLIKKHRAGEQDKSKKIYLTKDELSALYEMPLGGFEEQVRDVFLIGCFTSLRLSDYVRIDKSCIGYTTKGTKVIRLIQKKTKDTVVIPIMDDRLECLLKKYDYDVPNIWGQSLNRTIKQICQELSEKVPSLAKKERTKLTLTERNADAKAKKKGTSLFEYDAQGYPLKARYDLVSSHTARRSCITNMYLSGKFTTTQMMSISGHKSEATFYDYIKLSLDEFADNVAIAACDGLF